MHTHIHLCMHTRVCAHTYVHSIMHVYICVRTHCKQPVVGIYMSAKRALCERLRTH